jgi:hypothetical protein
MTNTTTRDVSECLRETGELTIEIPALRRPTLEEIQSQYPWVTSIERDTSPEEPVTFILTTVLADAEDFIGGAEYARRLAKRPAVLLGLQHRDWFLAHQHEFSAYKELLGKISIDFPGIVLRKGGARNVACVHHRTSSYGWLGSGVKSDARVAVARQ